MNIVAILMTATTEGWMSRLRSKVPIAAALRP